MRPVKIVILGAGSTSFAVSSLAALLREPSLRGSTLSLVDVNLDTLRTVRQLAERMNREWDSGLTITSSHERRSALTDADFVVCAIEVGDRERTWRQDWEVTLRHGLRQPYGENGGPGGFAHAARNIPVILDIACDMERLCPQALLIMLTNPLPRMCRAVTKYTSIRLVGLCHQINFAYAVAGILLMDRMGVQVPPEMLTLNPPPFPYDPDFWQLVGAYVAQIAERITITAAGLNHFSWLLDVRDSRTGKDLYPLLCERFLSVPEGPERLTRDMLRLTGYLPVPGDIHLSEYLPFTHNPATRPWERYQLRPYDWDRASAGRADLWQEIEALTYNGAGGLERLRELPSEGICEVIVAASGGSEIYRPALNVPNNGAIGNLPRDAIVEVPGTVSQAGPDPFPVGDLPPLIAELCRRETELVELVVDAAVEGDPKLALQALALDPTVDDLDVARAVLDDYLQIHREFLPQFDGRWALPRGRAARPFNASRPPAAGTSPSVDPAPGALQSQIAWQEG